MTSPKSTTDTQAETSGGLTNPAPTAREDLAAMMLRVSASGEELSKVQQEIVDRVIAAQRLTE